MSIVVITYQSAAMLPALWRSLAPQLPELGRTELYLIDNASSDDSRQVLRDIVDESSRDSTTLSRVELQANRQNLGFARGAWPDTATPSRSAANTLARLRRRGAKRERGRRAS